MEEWHEAVNRVLHLTGAIRLALVPHRLGQLAKRFPGDVESRVLGDVAVHGAGTEPFGQEGEVEAFFVGMMTADELVLRIGQDNGFAA